MANRTLDLDRAFQALADPTRRAVIGRLGAGPLSVGELAAPFDMALPSFLKHIHSLEKAGWITTTKVGRVRACTLRREQLDAVEGWLAEQRRLWVARTDRLERFVTETHDHHQQEDDA
ncbi:metalloregulator ArsR/SmtB family transcription factor [Georgenia sp. H159]|uniref:ArsR/SmtB family transcription factor n=1 Tax=Georgenia sp. H159 TaxID=3076115 RepID=UPI002D797408|nr:metalloregulator ArsR/SmtB family transcription factor [Georgenia sp. H159]